ncbi:hypothetical protein CSV60_10190 [Sporosarcina sp. P7]|nr:hypothetical protein CSV60_10190 [Sporosarcina sp. P7]
MEVKNEIHHSKHHQKYVNNLNAAPQNYEGFQSQPPDTIRTDFLRYLSRFALHSKYRRWTLLT